jgi:hypothetical protein
MGFVGYLTGYMTATNMERSRDAFPPADILGRILALEQFCRANPRSMFVEAVINLRDTEPRVR